MKITEFYTNFTQH